MRCEKKHTETQTGREGCHHYHHLIMPKGYLSFDLTEEKMI